MHQFQVLLVGIVIANVEADCCTDSKTSMPQYFEEGVFQGRIPVAIEVIQTFVSARGAYQVVARASSAVVVEG
jgi:hypothetical protein